MTNYGSNSSIGSAGSGGGVGDVAHPSQGKGPIYTQEEIEQGEW